MQGGGYDHPECGGSRKTVVSLEIASLFNSFSKDNEECDLCVSREAEGDHMSQFLD